MKKCTALLMALIMILASAHAGSSEPEAAAAHDPFCAYAVSADLLWQAVHGDGGDMVSLTRYGEAKTTVYETGWISAMDAYDGCAYIAAEDGMLVCIGQDGASLGEWDIRGMDGYVRAVAAADEHIALVGTDGRLFFLDKAGGNLREFGGLGPVSAVACMPDGGFVAAHYRLDEKSYAVSAIDPKSGSIRQIALLPDVFVDIDAISALENGTVYCITLLSQLYRIENGVASNVATFSGAQLSGVSGAMTGRRVFDGAELYLPAAGVLYRVNAEDYIEQEGETPSLVICGDDSEIFEPRMAAAAAEFEKRNPNMRVRFAKADQEDLVLELMSGSQEYDLFLLEDGDARDMLRAGLFVDLRAYPGIMNSLESWIDIGAMKSQDGSIYCIPTEIMGVDILCAQEKGRADSLGLMLPDGGCSYKDAEDLARQAREKSGFFSDVRLLAQTKQLYAPVHIYNAQHGDWMAGELNYDTEEFRALLRFWKNMADNGLIILKENYAAADRSALLDNADDHLSMSDTYGAVSHGEFMYFPNAHARPVCTVGLKGLYLYAYGGQKELASEFLAIYASCEAQKELMSPYAVFLKDIHAYVCLPEWTDIGMTIYTGIDIDPAGHVNWVSVLENSLLRPPLAEIKGTLIEYMPEYLAGNAPEDALVAALNERADILLNE